MTRAAEASMLGQDKSDDFHSEFAEYDAILRRGRWTVQRLQIRACVHITIVGVAGNVRLRLRPHR